MIDLPKKGVINVTSGIARVSVISSNPCYRNDQ